MRNVCVAVLFCISGMVGLLYEVVWAKFLSLVLGNTAYAHTVVLATFLGGLAIGNAWLGPWADRVRNQLRFYGVLELGIGLLGFASLSLLTWSTDLYVALMRQGTVSPLLGLACRLLLSAIVLLPPAILMGGTLPALSRCVTHALGQLERMVSRLYFLNSTGAVVGVLLAGFLLIPAYGLHRTVVIGGVLNVVIGLICLVLGNLQDVPSSHAAPRVETGIRPRHIRVIFAAVFLSGCVSLAYEIAWIRLLALVLGSSTYSFSVMLAAFIAGIALGSGLIARRIAPRISSYLLFGLAELGIAVSIAVSLPLYERLPYAFMHIAWLFNRTPATFYLFEGIMFLFCFLLMLIPTTCIGMTLPLASQVVTHSPEEAGTKVGRVFSINTAGNVVGVVLASLVLLPALGLQRLIELGVLVNVVLGVVIVVTASQWTLKIKGAVLGSVVLVILISLAGGARWDKRLLAGGEFRNREAPDYDSFHAYKQAFEQETLLYYKDDSNMTVTVQQGEEDIYLKVNGKVDASAYGDLATQILVGHIPLVLKPDANDVLVIGLGSGITVGSVLRHPIRHLDVVEISAAVVAATQFFRSHNYHALQDPRVHLHIQDAKSMLQVTARRYDVIISEPSNPWIAGIGNLFSVEFYREVTQHLAPGGLMMQWVHAYEINDDIFRLIVRTFASVFRHVTMWDLHNDILLIGSAGPLAADFTAMENRFAQSSVHADLQRIGMQTLATLLSLHMASDATVRKLGGTGPVNSDAMPVLEYEAPKAFYLNVDTSLAQDHDERWYPQPTRDVLLSRYARSRARPLTAAEFQDMTRFSLAQESHLAKGLVLEWHRRFPRDTAALWARVGVERAEDNLELASQALAQLLALEPHQPAYLKAAAEVAYQRFWESTTHLTPGLPDTALAYYQRLLDATSEDRAQIYVKMAEIYAAFHAYARALKTLEHAIREAQQAHEPPEVLATIWLQAADIAVKQGALELAQQYTRQAMTQQPQNQEVRALLSELERQLAAKRQKSP